MSTSLDATMTRFALSLMGALGAMGCASEPTSSSNTERKPSDKTGYEKLENGMIVRHGAATCDPAISQPACKGTEDRKDCSSDADCKDGPHGKCITGTAGPGPSMAPYTFCGCVYSCATDSDCDKDRVCLCGDVEGGRSECIRAFCRGDSDCEDGSCAYSSYFDGCHNDKFLQCKSADDKCQTNADCEKGTTCSLAIDYKKTKATWACRGVPCTVGRPLVIDGVERFAKAIERHEWLTLQREALGVSLAPAERTRVAHHYLRTAALEHASVASFARFSLGLMALGAPADLLAAASQAALDEVRHAKLCYGLAHAYGAGPQGPAPLPDATMPISVDVVSFTRALVLEGCVGETLSALEARAAAEAASDPSLAETLTSIAEDELRHALLAFRTLGWLARAFDEARTAALEALDDAKRALETQATEPELGMPEHGLFAEHDRVALRAAAFRTTVVEPVTHVLQRASNESTCRPTMSSVPASSRA